MINHLLQIRVLHKRRYCYHPLVIGSCKAVQLFRGYHLQWYIMRSCELPDDLYIVPVNILIHEDLIHTPPVLERFYQRLTANNFNDKDGIL